MLGRILLLAASLAVLHAAFSTYEHLSHLKALGKPESSLPQDIVLEAIIGLGLGILGASLNAAPLKEITWSSEMKTRSIDEMNARLGFANYVNRGRNIWNTSRS
ncbi:hypothetical protein GYMLUDRAFT_42851 [Collybiopsis luxurians FD-317 M1]|uniref:Magnesium transporter n=1 Tax=Collybiopsis luxurians FD-317 M1 TaxID=944289 RepID=A0A0D0C0U1_9AGAR|nr:hypothetical protein GYMLUDRAFT_42851 [Collybiopsis luxurians FD-317 M1]